MRIGDLLANVVDRSPCLASKKRHDPAAGKGRGSRKGGFGDFLGMNRQPENL